MGRFVLVSSRGWVPQRFRVAGLAIGALAAVAGCSGSTGSPTQPVVPGGSVSTPTPKPSTAASALPTPIPTATPTPGSVLQACSSSNKTASIGSTGGAITNNATTGTFTETVAAGQLATTTTVSLGYDPAASLPAPLLAQRHVDRAGHLLQPLFTAGAGNTYVLAFCTSFAGGSTPSSGLSISGAGGIVPSAVAVGTQLNIAINMNSTWVDVGTAQVTAAGTFQSTTPTLALPGVTQGGTYLVYVPAAGTNTAQINLGFALLADDGSAFGGIGVTGLQFAQIEGPSGTALATPTTNYYPVSGGDLDGQSLTPDASHGALVDGSSTVYFFSGLNAHTFNLAAGTVDVSAYGADGDSIASLPNGDEVVVTADGDTAFVVISGILAGTPIIADTIPDANQRDGLVLSNDGQVLLARGSTGLDVFEITATAAHAGSTGMGTTSYNFTLVKTLASFNSGGTLVSPSTNDGFGEEDGRNGMAISPADSSRALVVGFNATQQPIIQLLTGLTGTSPTISALPLHFKRNALAFAAQSSYEPSIHRRPFALTPSAGTETRAVAISPDGTTGYVSTDAGIITVSGVNTGNLAQVGAPYAPTITFPGGSTPAVGSKTIGILPDGKYLVQSVNTSQSTGTTATTQGSGVLLVSPIGAGGVLGAPVGQLNQVVTPTNDQMITH